MKKGEVTLSMTMPKKLKEKLRKDAFKQRKTLKELVIAALETVYK